MMAFGQIVGDQGDAYGVVYKITNTITGLAYIGSTKRFRQRMSKQAGKGCKSTHLKPAIARYGAENFRAEILYWATDEDDLFLNEERLIREHNTLDPNGYNGNLGLPSRRVFWELNHDAMAAEVARREEEIEGTTVEDRRAN